MNDAILLKVDDWEGLYINNILVEEGHNLEQGYDRIEYFVRIQEQYNFDINELKVKWLEDDDEELISSTGGFPKNINNLKNKY